ncbi:hypothetical protein [Neolewinella persica]|uniref:hypothetical protein n=1 Tax=Neolewinella persica TaxID=70998 RepID=UPI0012F7AF59|nr:hypothetical protein [Neolewinella persica]
MKRSIALIAFTSMLFACTTTKVKLPGEGTVPTEVLNGFNKLHEKNTNQQWTILPDGRYSVRYRITGFRYRDLLDTRGALIQTQQETWQATLPEGVNSFIFREYADYQIGEASKITFPDGEQVWDVGLKGPQGANFVLRLTRDGKVISQTEAEDYKWFM